jgi:hypothetical protein
MSTEKETRKMLNEPKGKEMSVLHKHETHHTLTEPMKQEAPATTDKHMEQRRRGWPLGWFGGGRFPEGGRQ